MAAKIDDEARRKANLRVLQRTDSSIIDIAGSATHVVLYEFSDELQSWEKVNCEGSLFLTKRSDAPRFKLVVLNRSSTDNLEVPVTSTFQMQVRDPYLIFREGRAGTQSHPIRGIWFHDGKERDDLAVLLDRVVKSLVQIAELERKHPPPPGMSPTTETHNDGGTGPASTIAVQQHQQHQQQQQSTNGTSSDAGAALLSALKLKGGDESSSAAHPPSPSPTHQNLVLDKKSLQLSLLSLIQDERFLDLIHAQYLKVAHARAARHGTHHQGKHQGKQGGADE